MGFFCFLCVWVGTILYFVSFGNWWLSDGVCCLWCFVRLHTYIHRWRVYLLGEINQFICLLSSNMWNTLIEAQASLILCSTQHNIPRWEEAMDICSLSCILQSIYLSPACQLFRRSDLHTWMLNHGFIFGVWILFHHNSGWAQRLRQICALGQLSTRSQHPNHPLDCNRIEGFYRARRSSDDFR